MPLPAPSEIYLAAVLQSQGRYYLLHDILVDLLPKVDLTVRRRLSEQLGSMKKPPAELMSLLVHDVIEVAGPLLEHADVSDEDLIDVVKVGGDAHREKISRRAKLTPQVRDALASVKRHEEPEQHPEPPKKAEQKNAEPERKWPRAQPTQASSIEDYDAASAALSAGRGKTQLYEDILRSSVDWTWETGRDFDITHLSDPAVRAFGRPARLLVGTALPELCCLADDSGMHQTLDDILNQRRPFRNLMILTRDTIEQQRTWWLSGVPCFDLWTGRFTGYRGTAHEIHDGQTLPAQSPEVSQNSKGGASISHPPKEFIVTPVARNIDKNAADLIQTLSHELRTPLNAILGFSEMIDHETLGPVSDTYHDTAKVILRSAHNLKNVITDVLDVAKIRAGKQYVTPRFFSLSAILRASLKAVKKEAETRKAKLLPLLLERDFPILNDPEYLERCLIKILTYIISRARPGENLLLTARQAADEHKVDIDITLLGGPSSAIAAEIAPQTPDGFTSVAFALSVAADLALAIGGEIRLIGQNEHGTILRVTVGDYPLVMAEPDL